MSSLRLGASLSPPGGFPPSSCDPGLRPNFMSKCYLISRDLQTTRCVESLCMICATIRHADMTDRHNLFCAEGVPICVIPVAHSAPARSSAVDHLDQDQVLAHDEFNGRLKVSLVNHSPA